LVGYTGGGHAQLAVGYGDWGVLQDASYNNITRGHFPLTKIERHNNEEYKVPFKGNIVTITLEKEESNHVFKIFSNNIHTFTVRFIDQKKLDELEIYPTLSLSYTTKVTILTQSEANALLKST